MTVDTHRKNKITKVELIFIKFIPLKKKKKKKNWENI